MKKRQKINKNNRELDKRLIMNKFVKQSILTISSRLLSALVITLALCVSLQASASNYPKPLDEYVNDFAGVIDEDSKSILRTRLKDLETETGIEMVVVTIKKMSLYDTQFPLGISVFSQRLFNKWGVGQQPDNDGVMLLVSTGDRKVRIQMGDGYNNQYDSEMKTIINEVITPELAKKQFGQAALAGTTAIIGEITREPTFMETNGAVLIFGGGALLALSIAISLFRSGKKGWGWAFLGLFGFLLGGFLLALFNNRDQDNYQEGFGGGTSSDSGADGSWDYDDD